MEERTGLWTDGKIVLEGFHNMYNPHIVREPGEDHPFKIWFFGWAAEDCNPGYPGCDAIYHARAKDLNHWEVFAGRRGWDSSMNPRMWVPVLTARDLFYDQWHNGDPSVVHLDGRYHMVYTSTGWNKGGKALQEEWHLSCIMGAVSDDGVNWERSDEPLLIWGPEVGKKNYASYPGPGEYYGSYARPSLMRVLG